MSVTQWAALQQPSISPATMTVMTVAWKQQLQQTGTEIHLFSHSSLYSLNCDRGTTVVFYKLCIKLSCRHLWVTYTIRSSDFHRVRQETEKLLHSYLVILMWDTIAHATVVATTAMTNELFIHRATVHVLVLNSHAIITNVTPTTKAITDGNSKQLKTVKNPVAQPRTTGIQRLHIKPAATTYLTSLHCLKTHLCLPEKADNHSMSGEKRSKCFL